MAFSAASHVIRAAPVEILQPVGARHWTGREGTPPDLAIDSTGSITVHVEKPVELEVTFVVTYKAMSKDCASFNPFLAFETSKSAQAQQFSDVYQPPKGASSYTVKIPVQRYAAGQCEWQPKELSYDVIDPHRQSPRYATTDGQTLADYGVSDETIERTCRHFSSTGAHGVPIVGVACNLARGQLQPTALKPNGSMLTLRYSLSDVYQQ